MLFGIKQRQGAGRKGGAAPPSSPPSPSSGWRAAAMLVPGLGSLHWKVNTPGAITAPLKTAWHWGKGAWARCPNSSPWARGEDAGKQSPACRESSRAVTDGKLLVLRCLLELIFDLVAKEWVGDFVWDLSLWRNGNSSPRRRKFISLAHCSFRGLVGLLLAFSAWEIATCGLFSGLRGKEYKCLWTWRGLPAFNYNRWATNLSEQKRRINLVKITYGLGVNKQVAASSGVEFPRPKVKCKEKMTVRGTDVYRHSEDDGGRKVHDVRSPWWSTW